MYLTNEKTLNLKLNGSFYTRKWNEHINGVRNWQYQLWPILIYQSWKKSLIN